MKSILFIITILFSVLITQAQDLTVSSSKSWSVTGSSALVATTTTNASASYTIYVPPFTEYSRYQLTTTTTTGTTLAKAVAYYSFDYVNWTKGDSVITTGAGSTLSAGGAVYAPYLRWTITAYTNAQTTNWKLFLIVKKTP
jgi:hypothetical protein